MKLLKKKALQLFRSMLPSSALRLRVVKQGADSSPVTVIKKSNASSSRQKDVALYGKRVEIERRLDDLPRSLGCHRAIEMNRMARPHAKSKEENWRCYLKQAGNSYSAGTYSAKSYSGLVGAGSRTAESTWMFPRIPNYVWLAMVILTIGAFSYSAYRRSGQQKQDALASYNYTASRVENAKMTNQQIKEQTERIRQNPRVSAQVAQDQLRLVRRSEIVVSLR